MGEELKTQEIKNMKKTITIDDIEYDFIDKETLEKLAHAGEEID